jgi:glycosyltransferase involved in cell wall biosynthesis
MNAHNERVSVVIATYNMARFLPSAVESAVSQTHPPLDVHIVDDGSTDDTAGVLQPFLARENVFLHRQANRGQANAKNAGILSSQGDFVAFLDADDLWTRDKLERQLPLFRDDRDVGVVYSDIERIDTEGRTLERRHTSYYSGRVSERLLIDNFVNFGTAVVRRECFAELGVFDDALPMGIDYDLWLRFSAKYEFRYLDQVTMSYRVWPGQMSHNYHTRYECAIRIMDRFIQSNPGLVSRAALREAWAHTFVGRANCRVYYDRDKGRAWQDYLLALKHVPGYLPAWKGLVKLLVR